MSRPTNVRDNVRSSDRFDAMNSGGRVEQDLQDAVFVGIKYSVGLSCVAERRDGG